MEIRFWDKEDNLYLHDEYREDYALRRDMIIVNMTGNEIMNLEPHFYINGERVA